MSVLSAAFCGESEADLATAGLTLHHLIMRRGERFAAQPNSFLDEPCPFRPKILKDCKIPPACVSSRYPSIHDP
ncbi:MAG TPA: hypothetical protein V6D43_14070 [Candidatus Sericytochromatia bacterium]